MTAVPVAEVDPVGRRHEWLELRRQGIGGSDVPAILGLDRFRSPFEVYLDKTGELTQPDDEESAALEWGRRLEDVIAQKFEDSHPELFVAKAKYLYRHPEVEFMFSNPDRLLATKPSTKADAILEVKSSNLNEDWKDGPPDRVKVQGAHYMLVHDYPRVVIAALLHGRYYGEYVMERDKELDAILLDAEAEFWKRVQDRVPPPVDGSESTTEALKQLYAHTRPDAVVDLSDAHAVLVEWRTLKARRAGLDEEITRHENILKQKLGDAEVGVYNGAVAVTWKAHSRKSFNKKAAEKEHPTLIAAYTEESTVRRLLDKGDK